MTAMDGWLAPQDWRRGRDSPCLSLGDESAFDHTHVFCPAVIYEDGRYRLWYASRSAAIQEHKYFAIGTAVWNGPTA